MDDGHERREPPRDRAEKSHLLAAAHGLSPNTSTRSSSRTLATARSDADAEAPGSVGTATQVGYTARLRSRLAHTSAARAGNQSGSTPIGRRAWPAGRPRWRSIAFVGSGFGASSPVS